MFIGEYAHTIDEKGRLAVPVKFRAAFANGAVVTRGMDSCLYIYPKAEWEELASQLAALPISQANARAFARLMLAGASDLELDKQGRAVIPAHLRTHAGLKNQAVVAGLYNRLEVWEPKSWQSYIKATEANSAEIVGTLTDLGI